MEMADRRCQRRLPVEQHRGFLHNRYPHPASIHLSHLSTHYKTAEPTTEETST